jgi:hypothetical protein
MTSLDFILDISAAISCGVIGAASAARVALAGIKAASRVATAVLARIRWHMLRSSFT